MLNSVKPYQVKRVNHGSMINSQQRSDASYRYQTSVYNFPVQSIYTKSVEAIRPPPIHFYSAPTYQPVHRHVYSIPVFQTRALTHTPKKIYTKLSVLIDPKPRYTLKKEIEAIAEDPQKFSDEIRSIQNLVKKYIFNPRKNVWKTDLCITRDDCSHCSYEERCNFAHSLAVLYAINLMKNPKYKTRPCSKPVQIVNGQRMPCKYGTKCHGVHDGELMQIPDPEYPTQKKSWKIYSGPQKKEEDLLNEATTAYQESDFLENKEL